LRASGSVRAGGASLLAVALCALLLYGVGCEEDQGANGVPPDAGLQEPAAVDAAGEEVEVVVTSDDASLPEGCRPKEVAEVVGGFVDAFNVGDRERLSRTFFIAEGPSPSEFSEEGYYPWSWYSVSQIGEGGRVAGGFVAHEEELLMRYFERRHERGERMQLLKVSLTHAGILGNEANVGLLAVLTRDADDLEGSGFGGPDHVAYARGAINCEGGWIFTWTMEMRSAESRDARDASAWLCKNPPGWRPGDAVIACA
jgi:hypothetical protein